MVSICTGAFILGEAGLLALVQLGLGGPHQERGHVLGFLVQRRRRAIVEGDLSRRLFVAGTGDELDRLAVNLNLPPMIRA